MGATEEQTFIRKLPCRLTNEEREQRLHEAKEKTDEVDSLDSELAELSEMAKEVKGKRVAAQARVTELVRILEAGEETREVPCFYRFHLESNAVTLHRIDNEDVIEERAMTQEERDEHSQMELAPAGEVST